MTTETCKKCGNMMVMPQYDKWADLLKFVCLCGHTWSTPPLNTDLKSTTEEAQ